MDEEIIAMLTARDEAALAAIRREYGALCIGLAQRILGSREDAEECLNDALLTVWQTVPPQRPAHFPAFLCTIVRRRAINRLEHETAKKRGRTHYAAALDELAEILPARDGVEDAVDQRALNRALHDFLQTLPAEHRRMFLARYYTAATVAEIAQDMQKSRSAVKMSLLRTRNALREYLQKEGFL